MIDYLTALIRDDPDMVKAYDYRGSTWNELKEYDKAIADYGEVIRLAPNSPIGYANRGRVWLIKKEYDKAMSDFDKSVSIDQTHASVYGNRANIWSNRGQYDKAIADLNTAIRFDAKDYIAYYNRGKTWDNLKQYDSAIADYNQAIRLNPRIADAYNGLAWLRAAAPSAKLRNGKQAVEAARKACELTGWKDSDFVDTLAVAYAEAGRFSEAVKWQQKAIELSDDEKDKAEFKGRLDLYRAGKPYHEKE